MFQSEELQVLEIRRKFTLQVPTKSLSQRVYSTSYSDRFFSRTRFHKSSINCLAVKSLNENYDLLEKKQWYIHNFQAEV